MATAEMSARSEDAVEVVRQVVDGGGYVIGWATGTYRLVTGFGTHGR